MPKPDHNFRPNPERSVKIFGEFNDALVADAVPHILNFRHLGSSPITVFINSDGGDMRCLDTLYNVLKTKDPDNKRSKIITVTIGRAGSAAATLLALGDYAIAYPDSTIHFHGVRLPEADDITVEKASSIAAWLQEKNEAVGMRLAGAFLTRLVFRYDQLKTSFDEVKAANPKCVSNIECFAECICQKLSPTGIRIVQKTIERWRALERLSNYVFKTIKPDNESEDLVKLEASILKKIVDFEVKENRGTDWTLDALGISRVVEDYTILRDYYTGGYEKYVNQASKFTFTFLSPAEQTEAKNLANKTEEEKTAWMAPKIFDRIRPFVYFSVSLCRYLQEKENPLTPRDAYWLGAIDEAYGTKLICLRTLIEDREEKTPDLPAISPPSAS